MIARLLKSRKVLPPLPPLSADDAEEANYRPIDWPLARRTLGLLAPYKWQYVLAVVEVAKQRLNIIWQGKHLKSFDYS